MKDEIKTDIPDNSKKEPSGNGLDKIEDIPGKQMFKMKTYAANLLKKHPSMKPERVKELTAKKFNIKLV